MPVQGHEKKAQVKGGKYFRKRGQERHPPAALRGRNRAAVPASCFLIPERKKERKRNPDAKKTGGGRNSKEKWKSVALGKGYKKTNRENESSGNQKENQRRRKNTGGGVRFQRVVQTWKQKTEKPKDVNERSRTGSSNSGRDFRKGRERD